MEATELRIGNYIDYNGHSSEKISGIVGNTIHFKDDTSCGIGYCFGIPLTPEILVKAGFEKEDSISMSVRMGAIKLICRYNCGHAYFEIQNGLYLGEVQYLHRLQNIYYALTQQELTINL